MAKTTTSARHERVASDGTKPSPSTAVAERPRPAVGRQIKRWRSERSLTLAQVAERSGLNVGYLSQIENDKASPSLESLAAIGAALQVPVAWFLQDTSLPPRVIRAAERRSWRAPGGGTVEEVDGGVSRELCIVQVTGLPGRSTGLHAHPGDEHHIMLRGRLRLTQGDHVVELGPGDYLLWDATIPHDAESIGDEPPVILIVSTRQRGTETAPPE